MTGPLEGLRVIDLSSGPVAGIATMVLSDFGADVVKIERPGGDPFRFLSNSPMWLRGKRSVELGCLSGKEDHGLVTVGEEELKCELVELWRDGGENRLELREPAAERLALAVPMLFWVKFGYWRLVGDVGVDVVDEREGGRRVGRRVTSYHVSVCIRLSRR